MPLSTTNTPFDPNVPGGAAKRRRFAELGESLEDLTDDTVADIVNTISDPNYMAGPDASLLHMLINCRL